MLFDLVCAFAIWVLFLTGQVLLTCFSGLEIARFEFGVLSVNWSWGYLGRTSMYLPSNIQQAAYNEEGFLRRAADVDVA